MKKFLACALALSIASLAHADENKASDPINSKFSSPDKIYFNPTLGFSPDMGAIGIEIQKGHHVLGIGLPGRVSYKWFSHPAGDSKFYSLYGGAYSFDENNEKVDDVFYRDFKTSFLAQVLDTAGNGNRVGMLARVFHSITLMTSIQTLTHLTSEKRQ